MLMSMEAWITIAVGAVVVPSITWLIREVLALRGKMIELETRMSAKDKDCERHQNWQDALQRALTKIDKNISRLCQANNIPEN
jgi:hypothetical protein